MSFFSSGYIRGLNNFISEIRKCPSKDAERAAVDAEFAKIKGKFSIAKGLSGYDYKKYIWKLVYAFMLGYDIDFGHIQTVNLCSSIKYSEKAAGYMGVSMLLAGNPEVLRLVLNVCKADLQNSNEMIVALALKCIGNSATADFTDIILPDILALLSTTSKSSLYVRRKAIACITRLARKGYRLLSEVWVENLCSFLSEDDPGVLFCGATLALAELERLPEEARVAGWHALALPAAKSLNRLITEPCPAHYIYYSTNAPWCQIALVKIIKMFPYVTLDGSVVIAASDALLRLLAPSPEIPLIAVGSKKGRVDLERNCRINAEQAVMFEAVWLALHLGQRCERESRRAAANHLVNAVSSQNANIRYLGLEGLARLAATQPDMDITVQAAERKLFEKTRSLIVAQLNEPDVSVRKQALTVLAAIADKTNWQAIVEELLTALGSNETEDLQEELVMQVASLADTFAPDPSWTVDVVFRTLAYAPKFVTDRICARVVQLITGFEDSPDEAQAAAQSQAAERAFEALGGKANHSKYPPENVLRLSIFILGEFGFRLISSKRLTPLRASELIRRHLPMLKQKGIALTALAKIVLAVPNNVVLREEVSLTIEEHCDSLDAETQERACELNVLLKPGNLKVLEKVLALLPPFARDPRTPQPPQIPGSSGSDMSEEEEYRDPRTLWKILCLKPSGALYESASVLVDLKCEYDGHGGGRVAVQVINRGKVLVTDLSIEAIGSESVKVAEESKVVGDELSAGGKVLHAMRVEVSQPFLHPPKYRVTFAIGKEKQELPLTLPVIMTRFMTSEKLTHDVFINSWQATQESEAVVVSQALLSYDKYPSYISNGFNMSLVEIPAQLLTGGIVTCAACGVFNTVRSESGTRCLVRIDSDTRKSPTAVRIAVRSPGGRPYTTVLANIIASYFVKPPGQ